VGEDHTREWWRREYFTPRAADRLPLPEWLNKGKKDCLDYAQERLEDILATHKPARLTDAQESAVEDILKEARNYYRKRGLISESEWKTYMGVLASPDYPYSEN
jgi:trimethylamine:corrinoid methyltransferase-like protein